MANVLVLYASVTGNTEVMADIIIDSLNKNNIDCDIKVFDVDPIEATDLKAYDIILMGTYTWSGGELPFEVEDFHDDIAEMDLTGRVCGVFGSGDHFYDEFCGAVDIMYDVMEDAGATMIPNKLKIDMDPEGEDITACEQFANEVRNILNPV